jgi:hypothetical protein
VQVWLRIDPVAGFCENGNEPSDLKKMGISLPDYQFTMSFVSAPCTL